MNTSGRICCTGLLSVLSFFFSFYAFAESSEDPIGVVLSTSGDVIIQSDGEEFPLSAKMVLKRNYVLALKKGMKTGKVQIGTADGPIVYKRFPVKLDSANLKMMADGLRQNYIASIGGAVLRSGNKEAGIFEWSTDIGALDAADLKKGFSVVVSRSKSSASGSSLDPLYFKLMPWVRIKSSAFEILADTTGVNLAKGEWTDKDGDFALALDALDFESGVDYRVNSTFLLADGSKETWSFIYTVYAAEDMQIVTDEIASLLKADQKDFEKELIRAAKYQGYNFKLKALAILKDAGVDIEGML